MGINRADEDKLCMAFSAHLDIYFPQQQGILVYTHIPLQGRSAQQGAKLKKMGVNAGWYDYIFVAHPSPWKTINLEAKVHGRDYSSSQKTFDSLTTGMPIFKAKFYSVREGHEKLIEAGVQPILDCKLFKEPSYLTFQDKTAMVRNYYGPASSREGSPADTPSQPHNPSLDSKKGFPL